MNPSQTSPRAFGLPGHDRVLDMSAEIAVSVGYAALLRNGEPVFEHALDAARAPMTVAEAEALARAEPEHAWEIRLLALLDERCYRRAGDGRWLLVKRGYGLS